MIKPPLLELALCTVWLISTLAQTQEAKPTDDSFSFADKAVIIKVTSDDLSSSKGIREWEKMLQRAQQDLAKVVIFDLNVKGDLPWDSQERILESLSQLTRPTIAFVNPSATGSGALIAIGSEKIYLSESGIIGGAGVNLSNSENAEAQKRELAQQLSLLKARARSLAKARGHRVDVVEAFIDSEIELKAAGEVISDKGDILTLTADEAIRQFAGKPLLATGTAASIKTLLEVENIVEQPLTFTPRDFARQQNRARLQVNNEATKDEQDQAEETLFSKRNGETYKEKVVVLKVGTDALSSGKSRFEFMNRTIKKAQIDGAKAVIFDLDTPGGFAWYTQGLILNSLQNVSIPTYSFVNTRAESAGAIVAIGTDHIYMRPAASIGSALVVSGGGKDLSASMESKQTQMIISVVRNMAELKGHNPDIAEAFVTRKKTVKIGGTMIHEQGEVLNLNTIDATEKINGRPVLAKGIASDIKDLIKQEGIEAEIVIAESLGMESLAHWVQKMSALLIIVGIAGVYLEMQSPGFGLPGILGLAAFTLFFFGNNVAGNLAGYELAVLFVLGIILIGIEIFLFPGAIIPALLGGLMVLASLALALVDRVDLEWKWGNMPGAETYGSLFKSGFITVGLGLIGAGILVAVMMRFLPSTKMGSRLILAEAVPAGANIDGQIDPDDTSNSRKRLDYCGWEGESVTDLRPSGKGRFKGKLLDIITEGELIPKDSIVVITKHEGSRIVVRKA